MCSFHSTCGADASQRPIPRWDLKSGFGGSTKDRNDPHLWLASLDWLHTYQGLLWTDWSKTYRTIVEKHMTIYINLLTDSKYNKNATSAISEMVSERSNSFVRKFRTRPARSRYRNVDTREGVESHLSPRWVQTSTALDWRRITSRKTWRLAFNTYMVFCQKPLGLVDIGKLNITKSPAESFQCRMTWSTCFELSLEEKERRPFQGAIDCKGEVRRHSRNVREGSLLRAKKQFEPRAFSVRFFDIECIIIDTTDVRNTLSNLSSARNVSSNLPISKLDKQFANIW